MSRIYNLKPVSPRSAVCIRERSAEGSIHHAKIQPREQYLPFHHTAPSQQLSRPQEIQRDNGGVWKEKMLTNAKRWAKDQTAGLQHQVEQLQLKEQEVRLSPHGERQTQPNAQKPVFGGKEAKTFHGQAKPEVKLEPIREQKDWTTTTTPRVLKDQSQSQGTQSKTHQQPKSFTINARTGQSPENPPKPPEQPVLSSSVSSLSPPSPPLFTIRSASTGRGKRGATITVTPRRSGGGSTPGTTGAQSKSHTIPQDQKPVPASSGGGGKKRYPTVDEIEVIGGYKVQGKSCLVKKRVQKRGRVCFDETQLERVYEYPSEQSVLASNSTSLPLGLEHEREERERESVEVDEEEDEEDGGEVVSKSSKRLGMRRLLRVDESCRL